MGSVNKKTVFELIVTKEWVEGKGYQYVSSPASMNLDDSYSLEEALAVIASSSEITNQFVKSVFNRVITTNRKMETSVN